MATINFNEFKESEVKGVVRQKLIDFITSALITEFGEDSVSKVGKSEIAVALGMRTLKDGTQGEVCATIAPVAKDFDIRVSASNKVFQPYERLTEADSYEIEQKEAQEKAEKAKNKRQEKIEADKKAREERKKAKSK